MTDIFPGDTVRCLVGYYKSYGYGELAVVKRLDVSSAGNPVLILANDYCDYGESMYSVDNWVFHSRPEPKKEAKQVATVRTQYFAVRLEAQPKGDSFLPMDISTGDIGEPFNEQTVLRHMKSEVMNDVRAVIKDGEKWAILQTCEYVEVAQPKPVLKDVQITSCR